MTGSSHGTYDPSPTVLRTHSAIIEKRMKRNLIPEPVKGNIKHENKNVMRESR